jgi:hypothetical protein
MRRGYTILVFILFFTSCNEISSGEKRLKLEYLYKMKMQLTGMMDYSFRLNTYERVFDYKNDIKYIKKEVDDAKPIEGWTEGEDFRNKFLDVIEQDQIAIDSVEKAEGKLRPETEALVTRVKERQDSLMEELDNLISKTDRE